jgi:hypothetical protein
MPDDPSFEDYLISKKIDSNRFRSAEPDLWLAWRSEFNEMHANSFTVQKLYLINPIRRKYLLVVAPEERKSPEANTASPPPQPVMRPGRPVIKPKDSQGPKAP